MLPLGAAGDRPGDTLFFAVNGRILGVNGLVFRAVLKILTFSTKACRIVAILVLDKTSRFFSFFSFLQIFLVSRDRGFFGILAKNGQNSRRFYYDLRSLSFWTNFLFRDFGFLVDLEVDVWGNSVAQSVCLKGAGITRK